MTTEIKPARQRISSPDQSEPSPFQYNIRLEILAEQIRAGKSVSMKDTLEVDSYLDQKQKALVVTRTSSELALEITAWICALGILGVTLWGLVT